MARLGVHGFPDHQARFGPLVCELNGADLCTQVKVTVEREVHEMEAILHPPDVLSCGANQPTACFVKRLAITTSSDWADIDPAPRKRRKVNIVAAWRGRTT